MPQAIEYQKIPDCLHTALLDQLTTAILLVDDALRVRYVNAAAESLLKLSGSRVIGKPIQQLLNEQEKPFYSLAKTLQKGSHYTKRQSSLTLTGGHRILVDYTVTPIREDGMEFLLLEFQPLERMLKISRDSNMLSSQRSSRTLVRGLAHEIKNPLGGLRGAAQLLAKELPDESLTEYTDIIIEEADRLRKLVDRLLGPHQLAQHKPLNIHEVLERVITLVGAESGGAIRFQRDYDPSIPAIYGDKEKLIQATLNIMRNAMQAFGADDTADERERPPQIELSTRILRQFTIGDQCHRLVCRARIVDNGPGIPADLLPTIFLPMVSGQANGSGLGLSIAQSILNQHRGMIECTSEPGRTRFTLYLPLPNSDGARK